MLLATDADWIFDDVDAALADGDTVVHRVRAGVEVAPACRVVEPDLVILDLQIGNMGGMATCMALRQDQQAGRLEPAGVLMLLDRAADVFLARQCDADGWLIKPVDSFRLRRAAAAVMSGGAWHDGTTPETPAHDVDPDAAQDSVDDDAPSTTQPEGSDLEGASPA